MALKLKNNIYKFLYSDYYLCILTVLAFIFFTFNLYQYAIIFFISLISIILLINEDIMPLLMPVMAFSLCMLKCYDMFDQIVVYWYMVIPAVLAFLIRLFLYPLRPNNIINNHVFLGVLAVGISIALGGLFSISIKDYFNPIAFSYVLALSPLMLFMCFFMDCSIKMDKLRLKLYLAKIMSFVCLLGISMVFSNVIPKLLNGEHWYFQWKNNLTSNLLMALPFPFYLSIKNKNGVIYYILGLLTGTALILSLSRGGVLFGTIMLIICSLYSAYKRKSFVYLTIFIAFTSIALSMFFNYNNLKNIIKVDINPDEARVNLYKLALQNFFNSPLFGKGLGYVGDFYHPKKGAIYWYHSTPFQIIASLGLIGVAAYSYQFIVRITVLFYNNSLFNRIVFLSFLGFSLYSLVNVNDFAPFPFVLVLNQLFIVVNKLNQASPVNT